MMLTLLVTVAVRALPLEPAGAWAVSYEDSFCMLQRDYQNPAGKVTLALRPTPFRKGSLVYLSYTPDREGNYVGRTVTLMMMPLGQAWTSTEAASELKPIDGNARVAQFHIDGDAAPLLPVSEVIRVETDGSALELRVTAGDKALAALRACQVNLYKRWGIDPQLIATVAAPPEPIGDPAISGGDAYPIEAIRKHEQGAVVTVMAVDAQGRPGQCRVAQSSGSASLDSMACRIAERRKRFKPASDASGRPTASVFIQQRRWQLPDR